MHLFRDEIVPEIETLDDVVHSESDKEYDPRKEMDINDDDHAMRMTTHLLDTSNRLMILLQLMIWSLSQMLLQQQ